MPDFSLKKWYVDVADDLGNVYIGYHVALKWGRLGLNAAQHFWRSAEEETRTHTRLRGLSMPEDDGKGGLVWRSGGVEGIWQPVEKPIEATLLETANGKIQWHCLQPRARSSVKSRGISFSGWGYAECIDITIPVWKLPFKTLYWGRCHTDNHSALWIKWEGETNKCLVWCDGKPGCELSIDSEKIAGHDFTLRLQENTPLRQGKIGATVLQPLKGLRKFLPESVLSTDEKKWYSRGTLETNGGTQSATVIHEVVSL